MENNFSVVDAWYFSLTDGNAVTGVPINESVQKEMIAIRDELGLDYSFPFED